MFSLDTHLHPSLLHFQLNPGKHFDLASTVAEALRRDPQFVQQGHVQIRQWGLLALSPHPEVTPSLDLACSSARYEDGQIVMDVCIAVAHPGAINEHHMVEQGAIAVGG